MDIRFLVPVAAMMHSPFHIYGDIDEPERTGIGTRDVRRIDGQCQTVVLQNSDVRPGRRHSAQTWRCVLRCVPYMAHSGHSLRCKNVRFQFWKG